MLRNVQNNVTMFGLRKYALVCILITLCVCTLMVDGKHEDLERSAVDDEVAAEVSRYQFFESVSDSYPQRTIRIRIRIRTFFTNRYPYPIRIRYDSFSCIQSTGMIEAN